MCWLELRKVVSQRLDPPNWSGLSRIGRATGLIRVLSMVKV